ncbi:MAG: MBL fold metallo-hydrolase [Oscillospiraceae bacterium]|nr:MBL fold metallo-hydrolase [Oscillospiraceae bacterium]
MYELNQIGENSFYIESPAKIGLVRLNDEEVCLIDSGNDKDAGRKVRQILDKNSWRLTAIYNTHSNADHIGGNEYLQKQTGCKIYAPGIECDFTNHPLLEPSFLYGAFPPKELRNKFIMAKGSLAELLTDTVMPEGMSSIELPGHFFDMVGFRSADDVVYLADCLSSVETLNKYQIGFIYDVATYLNTLEKVKQMSASVFVPAHAAVSKDVTELADINIAKVHEIADRITELCEKPISSEKLLQKLFDSYGLVMDFSQYALVGSTVRSYLTWLREEGRLTFCFENNELLWSSVS